LEDKQKQQEQAKMEQVAFTKQQEVEVADKAKALQKSEDGQKHLQKETAFAAEISNHAVSAESKAKETQNEAAYAQQKVLSAIKQAWAQSKVAQKARNAAEKSKQDAIRQQTRAKDAAEASKEATALLHKRKHEKAIEHVAEIVSQVKIISNEITSQTKKVADDQKNKKSKEAALVAMQGMSNATKARLLLDVNAANSTLVTSRAQLVNLQDQHAMLDHKRTKADAVLKHALAHAAGETLEQRQEQAHKRMQEAKEEAKASRSKAILAKATVKQAQLSKKEFEGLVGSNIQNANVEIAAAKASEAKATAAIEKAKHQKVELSIEQQNKEQAEREKIIQNASQEAAEKESKRGGSPEAVSRASKQAAQQEEARLMGRNTTNTTQTLSTQSILDRAQVIDDHISHLK